MPMLLGEMQPDACGHQQSRGDEPKRYGIALQQDRECSAEERGHGKIRSGARRSKMTERKHKHHEADTVADEPDRQRW